MPALRLKTKLVFAITAMVVVIVATLCALYISEVVHQRIHEVYDGRRSLSNCRFLRSQNPRYERRSEQHQDRSERSQAG